MTQEEIKNRVFEIIADKIGVSVCEIQESTRFKEDLGTDSLDDIELLMEFERKFGIKISDEETMGVCTVGDAVDGLSKKLGVKEEVKRKPKESGCAPDKIYVPQHNIEVGAIQELCELVVEGSVEYIRKDALLEWAKETYLNENASAIRKVCYKQLTDKLNSM